MVKRLNLLRLFNGAAPHGRRYFKLDRAAPGVRATPPIKRCQNTPVDHHGSYSSPALVLGGDRPERAASILRRLKPIAAMNDL